jgi:hypothetical protein
MNKKNKTKPVLTSTKQQKKEKLKKTSNKKAIKWAWPIKIFVITLILSLILSVSSELILSDAGLIISLITVTVLLLGGITFDMLGVAVAVASIEPFNAMSSKKITGAKEAIKLVKNAEKVSSFASDVVGDMCGILSGAVGAALVLQITSSMTDFKVVIIASLVSSIIAALTVFGKAIGKSLAINYPEKIVLSASKVVSLVHIKNKK